MEERLKRFLEKATENDPELKKRLDTFDKLSNYLRDQLTNPGNRESKEK